MTEFLAWAVIAYATVRVPMWVINHKRMTYLEGYFLGRAHEIQVQHVETAMAKSDIELTASEYEQISGQQLAEHPILRKVGMFMWDGVDRLTLFDARGVYEVLNE